MGGEERFGGFTETGRLVEQGYTRLEANSHQAVYKHVKQLYIVANSDQQRACFCPSLSNLAIMVFKKPAQIDRGEGVKKEIHDLSIS